MKDNEIAIELEQQIRSYIDLCAMYEIEPSILGFAQHLEDSYADKK